MRKDDSNLIQHKLLFKAQDRKGISIGPGLLLNHRGMPTYLLANQCTFLDIVNGARAILYEVILYPNSKGVSFKTI